MKKILLFTILLFGSFSLFSQDPTLLDFNKMRLKKTKTAMTVLGGWSVVNIGSGLILQATETGEDKYFHQMNAIWNGVNLLVAGMGYIGANRANPANFNLARTVNEYHKIQKVLIFNAGLDLAYVTAGFYLLEVSKSRRNQTKKDQTKGWGKSIVFQGGFLFLFDMTTAFLLSADNPKLERLLGTLRFDGRELGFCLTF